MNGVHDMGGMHGMGPIDPEADEPVFHSEWERRALALTVAAGMLGRWNIDMSRHAREEMGPADSLAASYYERWVWGLERLLCRTGLLEAGEVERRMRDPGSLARGAPPPGDVHPVGADEMLERLRSARGSKVDEDVPAGFRPGDRVRTRNMHPIGHTRLPRYARGRTGIIDRDHGVWVFPDTNASGRGTKPQHVYSVLFAARELWGQDAPPGDAVLLDLWEDYLEAGP